MQALFRGMPRRNGTWRTGPNTGDCFPLNSIPNPGLVLEYSQLTWVLGGNRWLGLMYIYLSGIYLDSDQKLSQLRPGSQRKGVLPCSPPVTLLAIATSRNEDSMVTFLLTEGWVPRYHPRDLSEGPQLPRAPSSGLFFPIHSRIVICLRKEELFLPMA